MQYIYNKLIRLILASLQLLFQYVTRFKLNIKSTFKEIKGFKSGLGQQNLIRTSLNNIIAHNIC